MQLGRTPDELEDTITHVELQEFAAWQRIHGPLPIQRPDFHAALIAAKVHNSTLTEQTKSHAKGVKDFLLWREVDVEQAFIDAMAQLGVAPKRATPDE